jgi:hypothetical protein
MYLTTYPINKKIVNKYRIKQYLHNWRYKFNNKWGLYTINESIIEFADNVKIIENYFN